MDSGIASARRLNVEVVENGPLSGVNIERPGTAEMVFLRERYGFHQLSLDDCLSVVQMPKLDELDDHLFMVMHFPRFDKQSRITQPSEVDVFAGAGLHRDRALGRAPSAGQALQPTARRSDEVREDVMGRGSGYLLYRMLDSMVDYSFPILFPILRSIMANVDGLERRVFETFGQDVVRELALVRRDVLSYRRVVRPQIVVLEELEERDFDLLKVDGDIYFGDLADHMRWIWSELEDLKEVVEGLYDAHGSLAMIRTNDIVRILTVAATVILPFVVVSSVYGMNIDLPFDDSRLVVRRGHGAERRRVRRAAGAVSPSPLALSPALAHPAAGRTR